MQLNVTGVAAAVQGIDESLKDSCSEVTPTSDLQLYSTILQSPFVQVNQGRPNLKQLISNEIGEATGRVSINGLYFQVYCSPSLKNIFICQFVGHIHWLMIPELPFALLGQWISFGVVQQFPSMLKTLVHR